MDRWEAVLPVAIQFVALAWRIDKSHSRRIAELETQCELYRTGIEEYHNSLSDSEDEAEQAVADLAARDERIRELERTIRTLQYDLESSEYQTANAEFRIKQRDNQIVVKTKLLSAAKEKLHNQALQVAALKEEVASQEVQPRRSALVRTTANVAVQGESGQDLVDRYLRCVWLYAQRANKAWQLNQELKQDLDHSEQAYFQQCRLWTELAEELKLTTESNTGARQQITRLETFINKVQQRYENLESELVLSKEQSRDLEQQLRAAGERNEALECELATANMSLAAETQAHAATKRELATRNSEVMKLVKEADSLKTSLNHRSLWNAAHDQQIASLQRQKAAAATKHELALARCRKENRELSDNLAARVSGFQEASAAAREQRELLATSTKEVNELKCTLDRLESRSQAQDWRHAEATRTAEREKQALADQLRSTREALVAGARANVVQKNELLETHAALDAANSKLQQVNAQLERAMQDMKLLDKAHSDMIAVKRTKISRLAASLADLEQAARKQSATIANLQHALEHANWRLQLRDETVNELKNEVEDLEGERLERDGFVEVKERDAAETEAEESSKTVLSEDAEDFEEVDDDEEESGNGLPEGCQ